MSESIQVLIVEDEAIVATDLSEELEMNGFGVAGIADNYEDALQLFGSKHVDIVLMDIQIDGDRDGVETAAELAKIKRVPLIYITAFTDAATIERVKHTHPAAFLVKPYDFENVRVAIDLALHNFAVAAMESAPAEAAATTDKQLDKTLFFQLGDSFFIKQNYRFIKFNLSEILFAETDHNYAILHTRTQKFVIRLSLAELLERINYPSFVRIHRSYAVNLQEIASFDDHVIKIGPH
ncbi:MAG TPA: response regulator, partial [Chitinophagaceae bacterium]